MTRSARWWLLVVLTVGTTLGLAYDVLIRPGGFGGRKVQIPLFTADKGGSFLRIGTKLAALVQADPRSALRLLPVRSDGSVENLELVSKLENAISFTFVRVPDLRRHGDQAKHVRAIALLNRDVLQIVVAKAAGIHSVSDLGAREASHCKHRVYVGLTGSGNREAAIDLLTAAQVPCFREWEGPSHKLNYEDAAALLRAGKLDAAIFATGLGAPAVQGLLNEPAKFALVSLDQQTRDLLLRDGYDEATLGSFGEPHGAIATVGSRVLVATHENTQGWIVQELADALDRYREELTPLLTPRTVNDRGPAALATSTDALYEVLESQGKHIALHDGLLRRQWAWLRSPWLHLAAFVGLLCLQLWIAYGLKPDPRARLAGSLPPQPGQKLAPQRVFISYGRSDENFVGRELVPRLEAAGLGVWWAGRLPGGCDFESAISAALDGATWVVAALSPDTPRSKWVRAEIARGLDQDKGVVPVIVRGQCDPSKLHIHLAGKHRIDLTDRSDAAFEHLIETLRSEPLDARA